MTNVQVESFLSKVVTWRRHGEDFEQYSLSLSLSGIAYKRWKNSVRFTDSPAEAANLSVATEEEALTVKRLLGAIQLAFQSAEQTTDRYEVVNVQEAFATSSLQDDLGAKANEVNKKRQSSASVWQKTRWVFHDRAKLKKLEEYAVPEVFKSSCSC